MKIKHFIMFLLFISLGMVSCSDNDGDEQFFLYQIGGITFSDKPISNLMIKVTNGESVGITGGVAPYTVETGDETIVKAKMNEKDNYVMISPVQLGRTYLVVKDANGLTTQIDLKIVESRLSFSTYSIKVEIKGISDDEKRKALEKEVLDDSDMHETGEMKFVYDTNNSGMLTIIPSKNEVLDVVPVPFTREIRQVDEKTYLPFIYVKYNGVDHVYFFTSPERQQVKNKSSRSIGLKYYWLVDDVTKIYKSKEAYSDVTSVKRIYEGSY